MQPKHFATNTTQYSRTNMSKKYEPPFRRGDNSTATNSHASFPSTNFYRSFDRTVNNKDTPFENGRSMQSTQSTQSTQSMPSSRKPYSDRFRQDTIRPTHPQILTEDEFPALMGKAVARKAIAGKATVEKATVEKATVEKATTEQSSDKPKKPTFAELASEWTKKVQEQKAKEDAERAEAEEIAAKAKAAEDKLERELLRMLTSNINRLSVSQKRKHGDLGPWNDKELDIGCANSDHSEDEPYNSNDDQVYEEEEDEEDEEEDADAFWNYRRNKNEMY